MKFLILSAISSAVLLYGMTLVLAFTGSTELSVIAAAVAEDGVPFGSYALFLGIVLIVAGFGFKISMVPFQMWVPDVYEGAPTPVTAYLSVASKAAGFAVILRVFYIAFGELDVDWGVLFAVLSVLSMVVGNLVAIAQNNIKRMLAYSTVAQAGYILIGVAAIAARTTDQETLGPSSVLFYLVAYAATNLAAFFAIIAITNKTGSDDIDSFAGMGRRAPVIAAILTFAMLSLIGIPPTAGFMGKLYIFSAAIRSDLVWLAVAGRGQQCPLSLLLPQGDPDDVPDAGGIGGAGSIVCSHAFCSRSHCAGYTGRRGRSGPTHRGRGELCCCIATWGVVGAHADHVPVR